MTPDWRRIFDTCLRTSTPAQLALTETLLRQSIAILVSRGETTPLLPPLDQALGMVQAHRAKACAAAPLPVPPSSTRAPAPAAESLFS